MQKVESSTADREIRISRLLNAPIELVWEVWTNPKHIKNWWGPDGFTNTIHQMDIKEGGEWSLTMHGPDGTDYKNKSVFKEIIKHKKIVYDHISGPRFLATIDFEAQGQKTLLNWHMLFESRELFEQVVKTFKADQGLKQNVEKLQVYLSRDSFAHFGKRNTSIKDAITIIRVIDAPRELVFEAFTNADMMKEWWGPFGFTSAECEINLNKDRNWKILMHSPEFGDLWCNGVFKEIVRPEKIVFTTRGLLDDKDNSGIEAVNTVVLLEQEGKTLLKLNIEVTKLAADKQFAFDGVEEGWSQSFEKLSGYMKTQLKMRKELKTTKAARVCTYLNFPGNTEEAFLFYKTVFETEFNGEGLQRFGDLTLPEGTPPLSEADKKLIIHVELPTIGGHVIMATDSPESMGFKIEYGNNMHISLEPETRAETKQLYERLSAGGKITMELQDMFWGAYFGSCTDKFGVNWMFNCIEPA